MENKLLNLTEACKYCGRTEQTMRRAIRQKEIPCRYFRGGYLFSKLVLDLWVLGISVDEIQKKIENNISNELITQVLQQSLLTM